MESTTQTTKWGLKFIKLNPIHEYLPANDNLTLHNTTQLSKNCEEELGYQEIFNCSFKSLRNEEILTFLSWVT